MLLTRPLFRDTWAAPIFTVVSADAFSSEWTHRVELLDHMVILFLIFCWTTILFSIVTIPFYIPTSKGTEDEMVGWHH